MQMIGGNNRGTPRPLAQNRGTPRPGGPLAGHPGAALMLGKTGVLDGMDAFVRGAGGGGGMQMEGVVE